MCAACHMLVLTVVREIARGIHLFAPVAVCFPTVRAHEIDLCVPL